MDHDFLKGTKLWVVRWKGPISHKHHRWTYGFPNSEICDQGGSLGGPQWKDGRVKLGYYESWACVFFLSLIIQGGVHLMNGSDDPLWEWLIRSSSLVCLSSQVNSNGSLSCLSYSWVMTHAPTISPLPTGCESNVWNHDRAHFWNWKGLMINVPTLFYYESFLPHDM